MIRTHRPRGYAWTCASLFQQTPDFRNIDFEDCQIDDQSDDFGPSERAVKRQRVERLADDFLNGHALYISSARLPPQGIQHAVARSFARPKDARRAMAGIDTKTSTDAVWEDVQDQWEVLRGYNHVEDDDMQVMHVEAAASDNEQVMVEVHAQASCTSHRRQKVVKLAIGPSDEALRQAAALRNRTLLRRSGRLSIPSLRRAQSEAMIEETQEDPSSSSLQATASDIGPTPTAAWTSSKWLNSGMLELRHKAVDEECSKDELGLSSLPTPSQKVAVHPAVSLRRGRSALSQQSSGVTSGVGSVTDRVLSSLENGVRASSNMDEGSEQPGGSPYVLGNPHASSGQENEESQEDSQARLLRRQGIRAAPRKSWTSFGGTAGRPADVVASSTTDPIQGPALSSAMRASVRESASSNISKPPKGKRATKSTGAALPAASGPSTRRSSRRKSAPSESQVAADSMVGLPIEQQRQMNSFRAGETTYMSVPGKNSSPFMFRKRVSKFNNSDDPDVEALVVEAKERQPQTKTKTPNRVDLPSDIVQPSKSTLTPIADPKTPLVNEYLNRLLPKRGEANSRSSSVRKALHDEMLLAGAEFSHVGGDLPSSQAGPGASELQDDLRPDDGISRSEPAIEPALEMPPPPAWPGTQVLLAEAQKDLFTSPNKENTTLYLGDKTTPQTAREVPRRRPLQTLSQEPLPMPSTQALLDGWQGWSSIKKPRSAAAGKRSSLVASPSVNRGSSNANLIGSDPGPIHSFDESGMRKSSLRYSISYNDSSDQQQTESLPVAAFFPAYQSMLSKSTSSTWVEPSNAGHETQPAHASDDKQEISHQPSGVVASSATFSQGQVLSTNAPTAVSSLSLHAGLSSANQRGPTQQQQQDSSISFSPINRSETRRDEAGPAISEAPCAGLTTLLTGQGSWSFSPLAQPSGVDHRKDAAIDYGTPAAPLPHYQQAQDPAGLDASGTFLRTVDMDSQELDFTVTDLVGDVLGSAKRDMPRGTGVYSQ